jgi:CubicO group peptidase (beta-lactamase class C family)
VAGNAGLFGTGPAAVRFAAEYLPGGGTLLTGTEVATATRPAAPEASGQRRTLGWQLAVSHGSSAGPALDPSAFGHTGYTGVSIWVDPVRRLVVGLFAHRHHPAHRGIDLHPIRRRFHGLVAA